MSVVFMEIANDLYHWKIRDIDFKTLSNVFNSTCCLRKKNQVLVHEIENLKSLILSCKLYWSSYEIRLESILIKYYYCSTIEELTHERLTSKMYIFILNCTFVKLKFNTKSILKNLSDNLIF